jgi:hypothetical protein
MRLQRIFWLCLLAALGANAVASATASAAPPAYAECVATEGPFTSPNCRHLGPPDTWAIVPFEFGAEQPLDTFDANAKVDDVRIETTSLAALTCRDGSSSGQFSGSKEQKSVVLALRGCRLGATKCASAGEQAGKILTNPLEGVLGYLAGKGTSTPTVGLRLSAETGPFLLEATCGNVSIRLSGAAIGVVGHDINLISELSTQSFTQTAGVQAFTSFEGGTPGEQQLWLEFSGGGYTGGMPAAAAALQLSERVKWQIPAEVEA